MSEREPKMFPKGDLKMSETKPSHEVEALAEQNKDEIKDVLDELEEIMVADQSTLFRIPRDGFDVSVLAEQEPGEGREPMILRTALSKEIKKMLLERGIKKIPKKQILYIEATQEDSFFSEALKKFATDTQARVGLAITGGNAIPFCEIEGKKFRILNIPKKFDEIDGKTLRSEINKIFIPSQIVETQSGRFLLMPIIDSIQHLDAITNKELKDFLQRLSSSQITPSLDLGMKIDPSTGKQFPESNMARYNGQLYLCDAGDVLHGAWNGEEKAKELKNAEIELRKRIE